MTPSAALHRRGCRPLFGLLLACPMLAMAQGDADLRKRAAALFDAGDYAAAAPLYSQLVSLHPQDHELNFRYGASSLYSGAEKEKAIGFLKYAVQGGATPPLAWYFLGRAYHQTYRFKDALAAYERYRGTADKKALATFPSDAAEVQARNGLSLLSNLKDIDVLNKVEVDAADFFRFYDLGDIGGKIVTVPEELMSSLDKKSGARSLVYLPDAGGPIYFSSYGKDGRSGRDIYRTELVGGTFATPVKVPGYINTERDEDFAVMAPDGRSFYFCSKGHNSMGGYDVFRSIYDKANGVFGPPENMDFAVNTPGDDLLYIVDAEGRQACFASGRDSKQGMMHVYRVGTRQTPVNITVIKGTFASAFDPNDRKARIVVEDAVTREKVGELRTDINGNYTFALPRGGRYKFLVQGGPGDLTHAGMVEVPRSDRPMAYRQEMSVVDQGGPKLMIKNYFDAPLEEDMMALALEEVQRRARLEVTGERAQEQAAPPTPTGDPMTEAGFAGNVTVMDAQRMAVAEERAGEERMAGLESSASAAWEQAAKEAADATAAATRAEGLVAQAASVTDEREQEELMVQAARERHRARASVMRAGAAHSAAVSLDAAREEAAIQVKEVGAIRARLEQRMSAGDKGAMVEPLKELKAVLDERAKADGGTPELAQARKKASTSKQEAERAMDRARSAREEVTELAARIGRLERERDEAKSSARARLETEVATLREQHTALDEEVDGAFRKAMKAERSARIAQGEVTYLEHLEANKPQTPSSTSEAQRTTLDGAIKGVESRMEAIAIDERYTGIIAEELRLADMHVFDALQGKVQPASAGSGTNTPEPIAHAAEPPARERAEPPATVPQEPPATVGEDGATAGTTSGSADTGVAQVSAPPRNVDPATPAGVAPASPDAGGRPVGEPASAQVPTSAATTPRTEDAADPATAMEDLAFMRANEIAELRQVRAAATDPGEQQRLDAEIAGLERRMREEQREGGAPAEPLVSEPPRRAAVLRPDLEPLLDSLGIGELPPADHREAQVFDTTVVGAELVRLVYADHERHRQRIDDGTVRPGDRPEDLQGLSLMLIDSIDAELARQVVRAKARPVEAEDIRMRVRRLTDLRRAEEQVLADITAAIAIRDRLSTEEGTAGTSSTPLTDSYVAIASDREEVYATPIAFRARGIDRDIKERDAALDRMGALEERIDSLEWVVEAQPAGKAHDRLRDQVDRLIDQHMVERMEFGQRSAFVNRAEIATMRDSVEQARNSWGERNVDLAGPSAQLARSLEDQAMRSVEEAAAKRNEADRATDVVLRDSLYRTAYHQELEALRLLDRAATVHHYITSPVFVPAEQLTYEEVERRLTNGTTPDDVADGPATEEPVTGQPLVTGSATEAPAAEAPAPAQVIPATAVLPPPISWPQTGQEGRVFVEALRAQAGAQRSDAERLEATALSARPADRPVLEKLALRHRAIADSLMAVSVRMGTAADSLEGVERIEAERTMLQTRMDRFYDLQGDDLQTIMDDEDHSRFFSVLLLGLDQQEQAALHQARADSLQQAGAPALAEQERSAATRTRGMAGSNLQHAGVLLNAMDTAKAASIARMEQKARKPGTTVEPLLLTALQRPLSRAPEREALRPAVAAAEPSVPVDTAATAATIERPVVEVPPQVPSTSTRNDPPPVRSATQDPPQGEVRATPVTPPPTVAPRTSTEAGSGSAEATPRSATPAGGEGGGVPASRPTPARAGTEPAITTMPAPGGMLPALRVDDFAAGGNVPKREGAIPIDAAMPAGVVFKVQVGAFRKPLSDEAFQDMTPLSGERTSNGLVRYTAGMFTSPEAAAKASGTIRGMGYADAFVVAYVDGKRVSVDQARRVLSGRPEEVVAGLAQPVRTPAPVPTPAPAPAATSVQQPATTGTTPAATGEDATLAAYPATAAEILEGFRPSTEAAAYYNDPSAAPARQVETVKGLFFTVQVGVYSKPTALDRLFNITPLNSERTETGKIRYTTGMFLSVATASVRRVEAVGLGVKDAFVTAYLNGKRIPMQEANALLARFGPSILAEL